VHTELKLRDIHAEDAPPEGSAAHSRRRLLRSRKECSPQPVRPALEVVPYGHTRQCCEPLDDTYDPGVQRTQR